MHWGGGEQLFVITLQSRYSIACAVLRTWSVIIPRYLLLTRGILRVGLVLGGEKKSKLDCSLHSPQQIFNLWNFCYGTFRRTGVGRYTIVGSTTIGTYLH